jgi:hypothetical protein
MEKLGKEIEELVKKSINPQKMEELGRQIEALVNKSLKAEKLERDAKQAKEKTAKPARKVAPSSRGTDRDDLERRIDQLEQKLDKLLKTLEESRRRQE